MMRPQKQHNPLRLQVDANNYVRAVRPLPQKGLGSTLRPVRRPRRGVLVQVVCAVALAVCAWVMGGLIGAVSGHWVAFAAGLASAFLLPLFVSLVIVAAGAVRDGR